ncbi:MAG: glycosyltransferase family 4 protein [Anaerolineales bacterium]|jgi:glycosyltransferase involved in cell wall biosynthesis
MKILHVTQGYTPAIGGTELLIQKVSEELVRQFGDEVTVFTTNCYSGDAFYTPNLPRLPVGWEQINGVRVRRFPVYSRVSRLFSPFRPSLRKSIFPGSQYFRTLFNGPLIPGLSRAIRQADFELAGASSFPLLHMFQTLSAAHRTGRPCVLHGGLHPQDEWGFQRPMIYRAIRQADGYIANTEYEARYVIDRGASPAKVRVVGVGVDLDAFQPVSPQEARQRLGLDEAPIVGFIGQIAGHKGVDTLVRAMPVVWEVEPHARLLIAGARTLFSESLEHTIRQLPAQDQAKITLRYNFTDEEKPWLYAALDVFAFPSGFESFGIAYLEAWAMKKAVIGTWRGAIPSVISAGRDGLLVDFQNESLLAEAILLLLRNPRLACSLGEAGYAKVKARYTWPEIARRFRQTYLEAVS